MCGHRSGFHPLLAAMLTNICSARYTQGGLDFEALFSQFDADGSGELDLEEFS